MVPRYFSYNESFYLFHSQKEPNYIFLYFVIIFYRQYQDYPFVGIFRMIDPCLLLIDPEIIKNIMVKDFSYFVNNDIFVDKQLDPLLGVNPFVLKNEEWKKTRQFLTPGFAPAKVS